MTRLAQLALTLSGELVPAGESRSAQVPLLQRVFELEGGPATGLPWAEHFPNRHDLFLRAREFLREVEERLDQADAIENASGAARSGILKP